MRIVIDGRYISDHFPGIGRYVYNLLIALAELPHPHQFAVLYNPDLPNTRYDIAALSRHRPLRLVATRVRPFSAAEQTIIPRMLRTMRADLYHAPYYVRPYAGLPCPSITTLYDAIPRLFPGETSPRARLLFNLLTRLAIRASDQLLAISCSARDDLAAAYKVPGARITVTPLAADPCFRPQPAGAIAAVRARYDLGERYILSLCSNKPHKNLVALVEAFAGLGATDVGLGTREDQPPISKPLAPSPTLAIAGHWDPRYPEARAAADRLGLRDRVRFLPGVAEADLPALYGGAEIFVFPSRYEGFGLPPLEALACGTPVIAANVSSLPEVIGDAGLLVEPTAGALAAGMARLLGDPALRARLRASGPPQAARFAWPKTAEATLALYEQVGAR